MNALADRIRSVRSEARWSRISDRRSSVSGADLLASAAELGRVVRAEASREQPMVAAILPLSTDALVVLTAAVLGDFTLGFVDPGAPEERRRAVLGALAPDVVIDPEGVRTAMNPGGSRSDAGAAGYVAMSSGSTGGGPKGVLSPWTCIADFAPHGAKALELDAGSVWAEISHPSYDLAMTNLLLALAAGSSVHVSASLGDQLRPLRFAGKVGATHVRLAPRFIDLAVTERMSCAPRTLRVWGSGGDRLSAAAARQVFGLGVRTVVNTYGTSETIGFASAARLTAAGGLASWQGTATIGTGSVGPWRTTVHEHEMGTMLAIESPHLPAGYLFGEPRGGFPSWQGPARVLTGDLGVRRGEDLYCLGRAGRRVKRSASFVDLDDVDATLKAHLGLSTFTASTPGGSLVSLVEAAESTLDEVRGLLRGVLRPDTIPEALVAVPRLPRLGNGKLDQSAAQRLVEDALPGAG